MFLFRSISLLYLVNFEVFVLIISKVVHYALQGLINNLITLGLGREAAFSAAVLGDNALMEKAWQDTGMMAEAVLHAHV